VARLWRDRGVLLACKRFVYCAMTPLSRDGEQSMDVQVDGNLIRLEREKRAWSQEHLAGAAGIGVRTVQRIEATGVASYESVRAISAALEITVGKLRGDEASAQTLGSGDAGSTAGSLAPPSQGRALAKLLHFARLRWLGAAVALAFLAGLSSFLLMQDYRKVRVLRAFEHWATAAAPTAESANLPNGR
jgi:transcriptional regulator with XRE-family HTH domain